MLAIIMLLVQFYFQNQRSNDTLGMERGMPFQRISLFPLRSSLKNSVVFVQIWKVFKSEMINYHLFEQLHTHTKQVRCVDTFKDLMVTGGSDLTLIIYSRVDGRYQQINKLDIFQSYLYSVRINPFDQSSYAIAVGCKDSKIFLFDAVGNPTGILEGHTSSVSSLSWLDKDTLVSGSWDATAIVWSVPDSKVKSVLKGHSHAVCVLALGAMNRIITGSQDGNLNVWEASTGKLLKKKEKAHGDIIREIALVQGVGFVTCSNDETVRLWDFDLNDLQISHGHSSFIFTVKANAQGTELYSGGEDRTARVWSGGKDIQSIPQPGSIWNLSINDLGDLVAACSDSVVRVFSRDYSRRASEDEIKNFQRECMKSSAEKAGMTEEQIVKLPGIQKMAIHPGKKEGDIKIFRQATTPLAYTWKSGKWELVGEVITSNEPKPGAGGAPGQRRHYPGDEVFEAGQYDYIFDVDDESGLPPKQLPFNNGANALVEAEKYCKREGLPKGYIEQVRKFLTANSSNVPTSAKMEVEATGQLELIPQTGIIEFVGLANPAGLKSKLFEFNQGVEEKFKLNANEKNHMERFIGLLQNVSAYHTWTLDFKQLDAFKKVLHWPQKLKLPVWDILRNYLKHYQSEALFSGLDRGMDIIGPLCQALCNPNSEPFCGLILRTLSNCFIQNTSMNCMVSNAEVILQALNTVHERKFESKNYAASFSGLIMNYSSGFIQKPLNKEDVLAVFLNLLERRLDADKDEANQYNYLVAVGNILSKYPSAKGAAQFARKYVRGDAITRDLSRLL